MGSEAIGMRTPSEWAETTLGALCEGEEATVQTGPFGSQLHKSDYVESGVPVVMPTDIGSDRIDPNEIARIPEAKAEELARHRLRPGDLIYSRRGDVERRALITEKHRGWLCGTGCLLVRPNPKKVNTDFLYYYLGHPGVRGWITRHAVGATMANLNTSILSSVPVLLMSRPEQDAIAEVLGALDDKIDMNSRLGETLEATSLALMREHGRRPARGDGWQTVPLGTCATWLSGGTPSTKNADYWDGDTPWISAKSLRSFHVLDSDRWISRRAIEDGARTVDAGAVLIVVRGMSLKDEVRLGVTARPVGFGQDCKALVPKEGLDPWFLGYALRSQHQYLLGLVDEAGHGTGRLATDRLQQVRIDLPPEPVYRDLVEHLRTLNEEGINLLEQNRRLSALRDALLPRLVSGELRIRDAERLVGEAA